MIERTQKPGVLPPLEELRFGTTFSDHMFSIEHLRGQGWSTPRIHPLEFLRLHPAAQVLHYGMCCFEGMKAYAGSDGRIRMFRPMENMRRLSRSSSRLALAAPPPEEMLRCIQELLRVDDAWVPRRDGFSIYIRPFVYSSSDALGVSRPDKTAVNVVLSPVGPYFPSGMRPVSLFVDEVNRRAWPGGVGDAKVGGNYAPTIAPQVEALRKYGTAQVAYTFNMPGRDAEEAQLEEVGAMNLMILIQPREPGSRPQLCTPPLGGTILPGITRDSVLALARGWQEDVEVQERAITLRELSEACAEKRLLEVFGCGTACVIQPVQEMVRASGEKYVPLTDASKPGSLSGKLYKTLLDIQYGRLESEWSVPI